MFGKLGIEAGGRSQGVKCEIGREEIKKAKWGIRMRKALRVGGVTGNANKC